MTPRPPLPLPTFAVLASLDTTPPTAHDWMRAPVVSEYADPPDVALGLSRQLGWPRAVVWVRCVESGKVTRCEVDTMPGVRT